MAIFGEIIMLPFVQSLESRRLLSASVGLALAEAQLVGQVKTLVSDAMAARVAISADAKAVRADLKALNVQNTAAGHKVASAIASAKTTIRTDVQHMLIAGAKDGKAIEGDLLKIYFFDAGNATLVAKAQVKLAADIKSLSNVETPFVAKLTADIGAAETAIGTDLQALVDANKSDAALQTHWTSFKNAFSSSQTTLSNDFSNIKADINAVIAAAG